MSEDAALIVLTHQGRIHTLLGPDGPVPYLAVEVDSAGASPYRIQTVIPRREYHLADGAGAPIVAAIEDIVAVKPFALPGDIKVNDKVLYRDKDKSWRKEEMRVTQVAERYECVLRNDEGDTCSVLLDHDIKAMTPAVKPGAKPKKAGVQTRRPRKVASTSAATPAPSPELASPQATAAGTAQEIVAEANSEFAQADDAVEG
ncbi:MAG: hypothetical protein ACYDEV_00500 [Acidiferrobacter sp.]